MGIGYHLSCLLCGGKKLKSLNGYEKHDLLKCSDCSFVFMRKIPTQKELDEHYSDYGLEDINIPETTRISINELVDSFRNYRKNNRVLDVGCGEGWILEIAMKKGWEVYGTEFSSRSIEICQKKGIRIFSGILDPEKMDVGEFDVIVSSQTIEHINNPIEEIRNIKKLLRKGGLFYITTPNFNSYLRWILRDKFDIIEYPEHLSYYTRKTLNRLLTQSDFSKVKLQTTGISFSHYQNSMSTGDLLPNTKRSADEKLRRRIVKSPLMRMLKNAVNMGLTLFGVGMTLKAFYIKE